MGVHLQGQCQGERAKTGKLQFYNIFPGTDKLCSLLSETKEKKPSKDNKNPFSILYTAEMLSQLRPAPRVMPTLCPQVPCHGTATALAVCPGGLWVGCPQGWVLACPRRPWHRSLCCVCPVPWLPWPVRPRDAGGCPVLLSTQAERHIQAVLRWGGGQCPWHKVALYSNGGVTVEKYPTVLKLAGLLPKSFHAKKLVRSGELMSSKGRQEHHDASRNQQIEASTMLPGTTPNLPGEKKRTVTSGKAARSMKTSICHLSARG